MDANEGEKRSKMEKETDAMTIRQIEENND
mgnify:CR=1 FL=1